MRIIKAGIPGVGIHWFFLSAAGVYMTLEQSAANPTVKEQIRAQTNNVAYSLGLIPNSGGAIYEPPYFTDAVGWPTVADIAERLCGMPPTFPLSPSNPFISAKYWAEQGAL